MNEFRLYGGIKFLEPLSIKEEKELFKLNNKEARDKIFEHNLRLVSMIIDKNYYNYSFNEREELFQIGCVGLWKAILNFNVSLNNLFSTYATPMIDGEIRRYLRDYNLVKIPRSIKDLKYRIMNLQEKYNKKYNRQLSVEELAELLNEEKNNILEALNSNYYVSSFSDPVYNSSDDKEITLGDVISDNEEIINSFEVDSSFKTILEDFSDRDQKIIKLVYGLGCKRKVQSEVGDILGISQAQVSRIAKKFKSKLISELHIDMVKNKKTTDTDKIISKTNEIVNKTIYSYFKKYDKEEVDKALDSLDADSKKLLFMKYPKTDTEFPMNTKKISEELNVLPGSISAKIKAILNKVNDRIIANKFDLEHSVTSSTINRKKISILDLYPGKSKAEILSAIDSLSDKNKEIIELRYGLGNNTSKSVREMEFVTGIKYNTLLSKIQQIKKQIKNKLGGKNNMDKEINFFEFYPNNSKEEVLSAINSLSDENKKIIELRYGLNGNEVTPLKELEKITGIKYSTLSVRVISIKKSIEKRLDKTNYRSDNRKENLSLNSVSKDKSTINFFEFYPNNSEEEVLSVIDSLSEESKKIIELRYGLNGNEVTPLKELEKVTGIKYSTLSVRVANIKKSIEKKLSKLKKDDVQKYTVKETLNKIENSENLIEEIKNQIFNNTFGSTPKNYNYDDFDIIVDLMETECLFAKKCKNYNDLDRAHGLKKDCYVYVITKKDKTGKTILQLSIIKDKKSGNFYKFVNRFDDGSYDLSNIGLNDLVCYDIKDFHMKQLKSDNSSDKVILNQTEKKVIITKDKFYTKQDIYNADNSLRTGVELFKKRQIVDAYKCFLDALKTDKKYTLQKANFYLGKVFMAQKKFPIAEKHFMQSIDPNNSNYYALLELGKSLSYQQRYDEALKYFEDCEKVDSKKIFHITEKARSYERQGDLDSALNTIDLALKREPNNYIIHFEKAKILYEMKDFDSAVDELNICNELSYEKTDHCLLLGKIEYIKGNQKKAIELFDLCVEDDIEKGVIYKIVNIGYFFHSLDNKELAYKYYSKSSRFEKWKTLTDKEVEDHIKLHYNNSQNEVMHSVFNFPVTLDLLNNLIKDMEKTSIKELYDVYKIKCDGAGYMVVDENSNKEENYITIYTLPFSKKIMLSFPDNNDLEKNVKYSVDLNQIKEYLNNNSKSLKLDGLDKTINSSEDKKEIIFDEKKEESNIMDIDEKAEILDKKPEIIFEDSSKETLSENIEEQSEVEENNKNINDENVEEVPNSEEKSDTKSFASVQFEECRNQIKSLIGLLSNPTEQTILLLRLPYVRGKSHTKQEIADFLNLTVEEVDDIEKSAMNNLSNMANSFIDSARNTLQNKKNW